MQSGKQKQDKDGCADKSSIGAAGTPFLSGFFPKGREHSDDQSDKKTDRRSRIPVEEKGKDICHAEKADEASEKIRKQLWNMGTVFPDGICQQLHERTVNTKDHT